MVGVVDGVVVGVEEVGVGVDHGLVEGLSATYRHGRDLDGYLEKGHVGDYYGGHGDTGTGLEDCIPT